MHYSTHHQHRVTLNKVDCLSCKKCSFLFYLFSTSWLLYNECESSVNPINAYFKEYRVQ